MKAIRCKLCASNEVVKQGDYFVCQACGTKYEPEAAKKLVVEVDSSAKVNNLFELARRERRSSDYPNAARHYEQILVERPSSWEAFFFAAVCSAYSCKINGIESAAKGVSNKIPESVKLLLAENSSDGGISSALDDMVASSMDLATSLLSAACSTFAHIDVDIKFEYAAEWVGRCNAATSILLTLAKTLDEHASGRAELFGPHILSCCELLQPMSETVKEVGKAAFDQTLNASKGWSSGSAEAIHKARLVDGAGAITAAKTHLVSGSWVADEMRTKYDAAYAKAKEEALRKVEEEKKAAKERAAKEAAEAEERRKRRSASARKIVPIVAVVAVVVIAAVLVVTQVVIPAQKAARIQAENEAAYAAAEQLYDSGDYSGAQSAFLALGDFGDSAQRAADAKNGALANAKAGDRVYLGSYEQDNQASNGKEDIEWRVLTVEGGKALLISVYGLDCKQYNSDQSKGNDFASSDLNTWLQGDFKSAAFSSSEQSKISEVTCLSVAEANAYFSSEKDRYCESTAYAKAQGAYLPSGRSTLCGWWLRSPGSNSNNRAVFVGYNGYVGDDGTSVDYDGVVVRPAVWVNL